jgi:hypothetical protein
MEPVVLPKAIAPVTRPDRVKRAQPREDSNRGSTFARYLRQKKEDVADAPTHPGENAGEAPAPDVAESLTEPHGRPAPKRVDIRV